MQNFNIMKNKAFSIAEMLITMIIISIVLILSFPIFSKVQSFNCFWNEQDNNIVLQEKTSKDKASIGTNTTRKDTPLLVNYTSGDDTIKHTLAAYKDNQLISGFNFYENAMCLGKLCLANVSNTSSTFNIAFGNLTLQTLSDGYSNIAIGHNSLAKLPKGEKNIAIGSEALSGTFDMNLGPGVTTSQTFSSNIAIGARALKRSNLIPGLIEQNIAIGYEALKDIIGSYNVVIGNNIGLTSTERMEFNTIIGNNICQLGQQLYTISNDVQQSVVMGNNAFNYLQAINDSVLIGCESFNFETTSASNYIKQSVVIGNNICEVPQEKYGEDINIGLQDSILIGNNVVKNLTKSFKHSKIIGCNACSQSEFANASKSNLDYSLFIGPNVACHTSNTSGYPVNDALAIGAYALNNNIFKTENNSHMTSISIGFMAKYNSSAATTKRAGCSIGYKSSYDYCNNASDSNNIYDKGNALIGMAKNLGDADEYISFGNKDRDTEPLLKVYAPWQNSRQNWGGAYWNNWYISGKDCFNVNGTLKIVTNTTTTTSKLKEIFFPTSPIVLANGANVEADNLTVVTLHSKKPVFLNVIDGNFEKSDMRLSGESVLVSSLNLSDRRFKKIFGETKLGLDELRKLKVKSFNFKSDKDKVLHFGLISQDVQKICHGCQE